MKVVSRLGYREPVFAVKVLRGLFVRSEGRSSRKNPAVPIEDSFRFGARNSVEALGEPDRRLGAEALTVVSLVEQDDVEARVEDRGNGEERVLVAPLTMDDDDGRPGRSDRRGGRDVPARDPDLVLRDQLGPGRLARCSAIVRVRLGQGSNARFV